MKAWRKKRGYRDDVRRVIDSFQFMDWQFWPKDMFFERRRKAAFDRALELTYRAALRERGDRDDRGTSEGTPR